MTSGGCPGRRLAAIPEGRLILGSVILPQPVTTAAPPRHESVRRGLDPTPPPNREDETIQAPVDQTAARREPWRARWDHPARNVSRDRCPRRLPAGWAVRAGAGGA